MKRYYARQIAELVDLLYLMTTAGIGSYVICLRGSSWFVVLGLAIICSTIPFTFISNIIWKKIKHHWQDDVEQLTLKEVPVEKPKLTFPEFIAVHDSDGRNPDYTWVEHWEEHLPDMISSKIHSGDCTGQPCSCNLCMLETWLREYREYYFMKENDYFNKENK